MNTLKLKNIFENKNKFKADTFNLYSRFNDEPFNAFSTLCVRVSQYDNSISLGGYNAVTEELFYSGSRSLFWKTNQKIYVCIDLNDNNNSNNNEYCLYYTTDNGNIIDNNYNNSNYNIKNGKTKLNFDIFDYLFAITCERCVCKMNGDKLCDKCEFEVKISN